MNISIFSATLVRGSIFFLTKETMSFNLWIALFILRNKFSHSHSPKYDLEQEKSDHKNDLSLLVNASSVLNSVHGISSYIVDWSGWWMMSGQSYFTSGKELIPQFFFLIWISGKSFLRDTFNLFIKSNINSTGDPNITLCISKSFSFGANASPIWAVI